MRSFITIIVFFISVGIFAQSETFDIATYSIPKGWKKETGTNNLFFVKVNNVEKTWCKIGIYKSMDSKGSVDQDFKYDWRTLVFEQFKAKDQFPKTEAKEADGWKILSGASTFDFNGSNCMALLTTLTANGKTLSIMSISNSNSYIDDIESFMSSIDLKLPASNNTVKNTVTNNNTVNSNVSNNTVNNNSGKALKDKYTFNTTNFDDGWTSSVQEDWVEVTKGNVKVLLHYPKEGTIFPADPEPLINAAWNILVAPRYSNLKNYSVAKTITEYDRAYFSSGNLTENKTGRQVYVGFFRKGNSGWIEIVTPDKNTFVQQFGFDANTIRWDSDGAVYNPLAKLAGYNKFAVATSDFSGKWSNNYASNSFYTNIYTGMSAGMSTYTSSETFEFDSNAYKWNIVAANSYNGKSDFANAKSTGTYKVLNNWQIYFTDIEKKPKTYNAYFSCIKGARILWLQDAGYGDYTSYGKVN